MKVVVVGAGWAGLAAAVAATKAGHQVTVLEAARAPGGRARALAVDLPDGSQVVLDNGQHILIGAYRACLELMRSVGSHPAELLARSPLALCYPDGNGLRLPAWPSPWDVLSGLARARGWRWADKASLLRATLAWRASGFRCAPGLSVRQLCQGLSPHVQDTLIDPLCVAALNTPAPRASAQVFLRVLQDTLLGGAGASNLLLPRTDLGQIVPQAACAWLISQGADLRLGTRADLAPAARGWRVAGQDFDAVLWASDAHGAAHTMGQLAAQLQSLHAPLAQRLQAWADTTLALQFEAIATVYVLVPGMRLPQPMLALYSSAEFPAQFVFDRGQLGGPVGLLALVVSAATMPRARLEDLVLAQVQTQLASWLGKGKPVLLQTVVEKRATFACTPDALRPPQVIGPALFACGDYVDGPYPATLEGAVRSGQRGAAQLQKMAQ